MLLLCELAHSGQSGTVVVSRIEVQKEVEKSWYHSCEDTMASRLPWHLNCPWIKDVGRGG